MKWKWMVTIIWELFNPHGSFLLSIINLMVSRTIIYTHYTQWPNFHRADSNFYSFSGRRQQKATKIWPSNFHFIIPFVIDSLGICLFRQKWYCIFRYKIFCSDGLALIIIALQQLLLLQYFQFRCIISQ